MRLERCGQLVYGHASFSGTWTYCGLCRGATKRVELANGALRTAANEPPGGIPCPANIISVYFDGIRV